MVEIPDMVLDIAAGWLADKIIFGYDCVPQVVISDNCVGFNVDGFEAGRVGRGEDGYIHGIYYSPRDQPRRAVFSR